MTRNRLLAVPLVLWASMLAAGCGADGPETERDQFLREVESAEPGAFFNDEAALGYLRMHCQAAESGLAQVADEVDRIVATHCEGDLAREVGVRPEPPEPTEEGRDMEKVFTRKALVDFGIVDPQTSASYLCEGNVAMALLTKLGDGFEGSFQGFAMIVRCPEVLREVLRHSPVPDGA